MKKPKNKNKHKKELRRKRKFVKKYRINMSNIVENLDRTWHENFVSYTEMIVAHPNYKGLFFERKAEDNRVKWVVAGKSDNGQLRRQWWDEQCKKADIQIEAGCYAKIAVALHPTKKHICQICGKALSIEYVYPNKNTLKVLNEKLKADIKPYSLTIFEIVEKYGSTSAGIKNIKSVFKIGKCIETKSELGDYIFNHCQTRLSPGVMSNSPDRFDGFHSDGNCCRGISDKGRHKDNLQRYSQDRRVYENWADGNWKMADRLMAEFAKHGLSADHIGPISLGFCHRAKFQPMTKNENSAKNNRMSFADIQILLADEANGEQVISWHSKYLWDKLKNRVTNDIEAVKLSSLMRNNLHQILIVFSIVSENGHNKFLMELLNPQHSFYDYKFKGFNAKTGEYKEVITKTLTGKNQQNNVDRYIRIAFESLENYKEKDNRKQYVWDNSEIDNSINIVLQHLAKDDNETALNQLKATFEQLAEIAVTKW
jgi:Alw26I/Eco31I/Esp3I family type II restriction endonuclease